MIGKIVLNWDELVGVVENPPPADLFTEIDEKIKQLLEAIAFNNRLMEDSVVFSADLSIDIPAIPDVYKNTFSYTESELDCYLTGLTVACTGYNIEDYVDFYVNGTRIIHAMTLKELGQYKDFKNYIYVKKDDIIVIEYHNLSGHSKMFFCDLDYIVLNPLTQ